jgi:hypothetical protein
MGQPFVGHLGGFEAQLLQMRERSDRRHVGICDREAGENPDDIAQAVNTDGIEEPSRPGGCLIQERDIDADRVY